MDVLCALSTGSDSTATGDLAGPSGGSLVSRDYYTTDWYDAETYNDLEQLTYLTQPASGSISMYNMSAVQYVYTDLSGGLDDSRLMAMVYPNGRVEDYD